MAEVAILKHTSGVNGTVATSVDSARFVSIGLGVAAPVGTGLALVTSVDITESTDPGGTANIGKVYTKDVSSVTELFYQDSDSNVVQISSGGGILVSLTAVATDLQFLAADRTIDIAAAAAETAGNTLTVSSGAGGASVGVAAGGDGGTIIVEAATGGAGDATFAAGAGGGLSVVGGAAGADGGGGGADGGNVTINGGAATGSGTDGVVSIGTSNTSEINIGAVGGGAFSWELSDNLTSAGSFAEATNEYLTFRTTNGGELIIVGPTAGNGVPSIQVNMPQSTNDAFELRVASSHYFRVNTSTTVGSIVMGSSLARTEIDIPDNNSTAFKVEHAGTGADYINCSTANAGPSITFGSTTESPIYRFAGTGEVRIDGEAIRLTEQSGDPGSTTNAGKVYTKDVAGITELFYQRSDGTVVQLS